MFNFPDMAPLWEAFANLARSMERIADVAYSWSQEQQLGCPHANERQLCALTAGHPGEHDFGYTSIGADGTPGYE